MIHRSSFNAWSARFVFVAFAGWLVVGGLAGCNQGPRTMRIWGQVTFDGQPIEEGDIVFFPSSDTNAPSTGGPIVKGAYDVAADQGPIAGGSYRVEIKGLGKPRKYTPNASGEGPFIEVRDNFVPAKYNRETTLTVTVSDKPAENRHYFTLTP